MFDTIVDKVMRRAYIYLRPLLLQPILYWHASKMAAMQYIQYSLQMELIGNDELLATARNENSKQNL